jgi:hypothetical protein
MGCLGLAAPIDPTKCTFMVIRYQMAAFLGQAFLRDLISDNFL